MRASEIAERLARGEPCPCCEAEWTDRQLLHREGCAWAIRPDDIRPDVDIQTTLR